VQVSDPNGGLPVVHRRGLWTQAMSDWMPLWSEFIFMFLVGSTGGLSYVNTSDIVLNDESLNVKTSRISRNGHLNLVIIKVQTQLTRMRFATVWKYCEQQWFQNMTMEVRAVITVLLSSQVHDVESINSPNNVQHEFLFPDLLLHLLRDIIS
jgi:hypothetical protein